MTIKVTAEDGSVKEYIIEVNKESSDTEKSAPENKEVTKTNESSSIGTFFANSWIVLIVSFCALIQSSIAVYYVIHAYKNSSTTK